MENSIRLEIKELGRTLTNFTSYSFTTDFMGANSAWSVEIDASYNTVDGENGGPPLLLNKIKPGQTIRLYVNNTLSCTGYIDKVGMSSSASGTVMHVSGRDALAPVIDACIDPKFSFSEAQTIEQLVKKVVEPFGFTKISAASIKGSIKLANKRNAYLVDDTGRDFITKTITSPISTKFKPHPGEGCYQFLERIGRRFGYHVWADVDGETIFLGQPNYTSPAFFSIQHGKFNDVLNNTISSELTVDMTHQPSAIIAEGHGGGGKFKRQGIKSIMINEFLYKTDPPEIKKLKATYKEAKLVPRRAHISVPSFIVPPKYSKPMWMHDDSSNTAAQLENFVRRNMAEIQSRLLTLRYTVNKHTQGEAIWAPNTIVYVDDYVNGIHQNMWIKSRTFTKDRSGGTKTTIDCILPYSLELVPENQNE